MKLLAIKTKDNFYISENIELRSYSNDNIPSYLFDGEKAEKTLKQYWYSVKQEPKEIIRELPEKQVNTRWELKQGFPESELTPKILKSSPFDEESDYYDVCGLYQVKYETEKAGFEKIDFEIIIIAEDDNFKIIKQDFQVKYNLIDEITIPDVLLPTRPCSISGKQFYDIIRRYVQHNIDSKYAKITSDYDFCFTVTKHLEYASPKPYKVDVGTKRRPNYVTRYNTHRDVKIFETSPQGYSNYPTQEGISGSSYEDLENNIREYLSELIKKINEPAVDCECCGGVGVILKSLKNPPKT
jgi:hypothetical protein